MDFVQHPLRPPLASWVEAIFHFKNFQPDHSIERVVPTGHMFILFELDGITRHTYDDDLKVKGTYKQTWISGMHRNFISISAPQDSEMCVIQFKPFGAFPFLHQPVWGLTEQIKDSQSVFGPDILALQHQLMKGNSQQKFEAIEQWLMSRFDVQKLPPPELVDLVTKFQQSKQGTFRQLSERYQYSQKHLIDQFKKYVGLTPKYFHRICRFNDLLAQINQQQKISWAQVAYSCGFSDQSHFIREFRHFSGFNPQDFIDQDLNQQPPNFFPLDREG